MAAAGHCLQNTNAREAIKQFSNPEDAEPLRSTHVPVQAWFASCSCLGMQGIPCSQHVHTIRHMSI